MQIADILNGRKTYHAICVWDREGIVCWEGDLTMLTIRDAFQRNGKQIEKYSNKISGIRKMQKELEAKIEEDPENAEAYQGEYDKLELSYQALLEKRDEYMDYGGKLMEQSMLIQNAKVAEQQAEAMNKAADDMAKCMEVASRYGRGERVSAKDLQKLMQMFPDLYKMAVAQRMMEEHRDNRKQKDVFDDEDNTPKDLSVTEEVANTEASIAPPEMAEPETVIAESNSATEM